MKKYDLFIDGKFTAPKSEKYFDSYNPFTGEVWAQVAQANTEDVDQAVNAAHKAFSEGPWSSMTASQRGLLLHKLGTLIARDAKELATIEVQDNGKLFAEMFAQLNYVPQWFYYYGGLADKIEGGVIPLDKKGFFSFTRKEPLGVVAVITPWNSPIMLTAWKIAPALAAGCTVVIKPSEFTSISILHFVKLFEEAGFPPGVVNVITGFGKETGSSLVEHPLTKKITFTGSDSTGKLINQQAAAHLKHVSLELGGKSPNIVFEDANLDDAVNGAVAGIFAATGQTCIAGSRLLVQDSIYDQLVQKLVNLSKTAKMGDPMSGDTQIGPVTTRPQYEKILSYIDIAKNEGAKLLLGGAVATRPECPVLSIIRFKDEEEAIKIANDSKFGLGAGVWTSDIGRAFRMSEKIQSGTVWVNTYRAVSYMAPFGGFKESGLGRENGIEAIQSYLQTKCVWINTGAPSANPFTMR